MPLEPTERLQYLSDVIISRILQSNLDRAVVTTQLQPEVFHDENFLIYKTIYNFREKGIIPDKEFLTMYLTRNPKMILENKNNVEPNLFSDTGDDVVTSFIIATVNKLVRLQKEDHSKENLQLLLEKFRIDFKTIYTQKVLDVTKLILNDKYQVSYNKVLSGVEDSQNYFKDEMVKLETLISNDSGGGYIDASEAGMNDDTGSKPYQVAEFGDIGFLNEHFGGIKTGYMYNIMAPPKGGKSKLLYRITHSGKVKFGTNVIFWSQEGSKEKVFAELRAIHFDYYYNVLENNNYTGLTGQMILDDDFPSDEYRELESISRADFFTNTNYGTLHLIDEPLNYETYINHLTSSVNRFGAKMVLIDYLQLMKSKSGKISKSEVIGRAYQESLGFTGKHQIAFISPSQFNQEFIKEINKGKDVDTRVGGGESAEIVRTPDVNIALYGTPTDIENNKLTLLSVPSRVAKPFEPTDIFVDLGFCYYRDITW